MDNNELRAGNPLRCVHGRWDKQKDVNSGLPYYACKLNQDGQFMPQQRRKCCGYPDNICRHFVRQPKPIPIPGMN